MSRVDYDEILRELLTAVGAALFVANLWALLRRPRDADRIGATTVARARPGSPVRNQANPAAEARARAGADRAHHRLHGARLRRDGRRDRLAHRGVAGVENGRRSDRRRGTRSAGVDVRRRIPRRRSDRPPRAGTVHPRHRPPARTAAAPTCDRRRPLAGVRVVDPSRAGRRASASSPTSAPTIVQVPRGGAISFARVRRREPPPQQARR